ncbi:MAG: hypothetical protein CMQ12_00980 [Gammaproteobacteria bacterium]|nr:hypothetical protein [Gammaproteobacteria bacterium]
MVLNLHQKRCSFWSQDTGVKLQSGKPTQNAFVESFNGKFRDTCLNQYWFRGLSETQTKIEMWRQDYNEIRPHSSLGYQPPAVMREETHTGSGTNFGERTEEVESYIMDETGGSG